MLRLVALTYTRIDADVLEEFLRHTARFVDHHYVVDLDSPDPSLQIVRSLIDEGLPLTLWSIAADHPLTMVGPHVRSIFERSGCDYVLLLDADEFVAASDRDRLEWSLRALPPGVHARVPWITYLPVRGDDPSEPRVLARIRHRRRFEPHPDFKAIVHRSFLARPEWTIEMGQHSVVGPDAAMADLPGIALAHFPVRDLQQIQRKAFTGAMTLLAGGIDLESSVGYQWLSTYRRLFLAQNDGETELYELAARYFGDASESDGAEAFVLDPLPVMRRVHTPASPGILDVVVTVSQQLASVAASLRRCTMPMLPDAQAHLPDLPAVSGDVDAIWFLDADGSGSSRLRVRGRVRSPDPANPIDRVVLVFPAKIAELSLAQSEFSGDVSLAGLRDGLYTIRIAARSADGAWSVLPNNELFEVRGGAGRSFG